MRKHFLTIRERNWHTKEPGRDCGECQTSCTMENQSCSKD